MKVSRRDFVSVAAASVTATAFGLHGTEAFASFPALIDASRTCGLIDLGSECFLRESLLGYQAALRDTDAYVTPLHDARPTDRRLIVPGAGALSEPTAEGLLPLLENGAQVLLESAAGFCDAPAFATHQRILRRYFDLTLEPPIHLWSLDCAHDAASQRCRRLAQGGPNSTPYIDYVWPAQLSVRDFSKAIPVSAEPAEVIAYAGQQVVAVRKAVASGTLIFLGSPLGPGLRAGEPEAHSLLRLLTSATVRSAAPQSSHSISRTGF